MSWFGGYKQNKPSTADLREANRQRLQAERLDRAKKRQERQNQLQSVIQARQEADQAIENLLHIDPEIFKGEGDSIAESEIESLLAEDIMADFDREDGTDGKEAMKNLATVSVAFDKEDLYFWFTQLEGQLEMIEVKSQWMKRLAMQKFLPLDYQTEIKSLLRLSKTEAGNDIYYKIKQELLELFGQKPEDSYIRAKNRVLTGKPSQLGKALVDDICDKKAKLDGCCCAKIVWGMFREALPIVIRNHIAQEPFNKDTYKEVFRMADKVWDSNIGPEPLPSRPVAATTVAASKDQPEVAAVQKSSQGAPKWSKNKKNQNPKKNDSEEKEKKTSPKPAINDEQLCRIHAKWKRDANFCAAPWGCKMKNIYKAPQ